MYQYAIHAMRLIFRRGSEPGSSRYADRARKTLQVSVSEPGTRRLIALSVPILFTLILQSSGIAVNTFWVGHYLGAGALAALSNANSMLVALYGLTFGASAAACIMIGQRVGSHSLDEAKRIVGTSASIFAAGGCLVGAAAMAGAIPLVHALNVPPAALAMTLSYLRVMLLALAPIFVYGFVVAAVQATGDSRTPAYFMVGTIAIDCGLNPVLIFGLGPIHGRGIEGAALATLIAQSTGLACLLGYLYARGHCLCIHWSERRLLRIDWGVAAGLLRRGIPLNAQLSVAAAQQLLYMYLANSCGIEFVAAFGASAQIWSYIQMPTYAIGVATTVIASQLVGAKQWERVRTVLAIGVACSIAGTAGALALNGALGNRALGLFLNGGAGPFAIARHINHEVSWSYVFASIYTTIFAVANAKGEVWGPVAILSGVLAVRYAITEAVLSTYHAEAILWSFPASGAATALLALLYHWRGNGSADDAKSSCVAARGR